METRLLVKIIIGLVLIGLVGIPSYAKREAQEGVECLKKEGEVTVSDVTAYHRERTGHDLHYNELKKVYTEIALQESQTGGDPYKMAECVERALAFEQEDLTRLQLYTYLGDAYWRQTKKYTPEVWGPQRRKAAQVYLSGLRDVLRYELPAEPPKLPAVGRFTTVDGPPEIVQKYREKHEHEMTARRKAERIRKLIQYRQTLTGQVVQMYAREPDGFQELHGLVSKFIGSEQAADKMVEAARAYRSSSKSPIPAIQSWGKEDPSTAFIIRPDGTIRMNAALVIASIPTVVRGKSDLKRFNEELQLAEKVPDGDSRIEHLLKALTYRPNHPDNIAIEYSVAWETAGITDPQTHQYIRTGEARQIFEGIAGNYNHMDYYTKEGPNHPRSPQIIIPECAIMAGYYSQEGEKRREYFDKAMECLNQTYQRREKDWQSAPAPQKPSEDSPWGGLHEVAKWESRMFMWKKHKWDAERGNVLNGIELSLVKRAVKLYLLSYLSKNDDSKPPTNYEKVRRATVEINRDFPDTPMAEWASEYAGILTDVLNR